MSENATSIDRQRVAVEIQIARGSHEVVQSHGRKTDGCVGYVHVSSGHGGGCTALEGGLPVHVHVLNKRLQEKHCEATSPAVSDTLQQTIRSIVP